MNNAATYTVKELEAQLAGIDAKLAALKAARMQRIVSVLTSLANRATSYERYACTYVDILEGGDLTFLKAQHRLANTNGNLTFSKYVNRLLGKLSPAKDLV